ADELRRRGHTALVPPLHDDESIALPFWHQEVESVVAVLERDGANLPLILVGHSGAGALLPEIARRAGRPLADYVFADAGLPLNGQSRLDEMTANSPEFAAQLRADQAAGHRFPEWSADDLRPFIPDDRLRAQMVAELRPRPLAFFEEPIP